MVRLLSTKLPKISTDTFELEGCFISKNENISIEGVCCSQTSHSGRFLVQGFSNGSLMLRILNQNEGDEKKGEEGETEVFLDPNKFSEDGSESMAGSFLGKRFGNIFKSSP